MSDREAKRVILFVFLVFLFIALRFPVEKIQSHAFFDDEAIYYMMTYSLAFDHDLKYEKKDLLRFSEFYGGLPQGIFLKKNKRGIFFAKSFAYPLVASPFVRVFKNKGFFMLSCFLLLMDLLIIYSLARKKFEPSRSLAIALGVMFLSVMWVYSLWISTEFFNFSLGLLILYWGLEKRKNLYPFLAALLLGFLAFSKPTNSLYALPIIGVRFFRFRWKEFLLSFAMGMTFIVSAGGFFMANKAMTGEWNYMGGERRSFYYHFPYESNTIKFKYGNLMSARDYWQRFYLTPKIFLLNVFYFFFGRFSGIFIYFLPAFILLIAFRGGGLKPWILFVSIFIGIFSSVALMPDNFIGGGGCLGNRYFPNFYPLFIVLIPYVRKWFAKPILLSALFLYPLFLTPLTTSSFPSMIGKMGFRDIFPVEITQINSLPTNINPHAFRVKYGKFYIYHLDDNFCSRKNGFIRLRGEKKAEMIIAAPLEVRGISADILASGPVVVKMDGAKRRLRRGGRIDFKVKGTIIRRTRYIFFSVKSQFYEEDLEGGRFCGAQVRLRPIYSP